MNAETADSVGTPQLKLFLMVNIDMFRHPKYYKELRKLRNKEARRVPGCLPTNELHNSDQAISLTLADGCNGSVRPGPGLKQQASSKPEPSSGSQASSDKR